MKTITLFSENNSSGIVSSLFNIGKASLLYNLLHRNSNKNVKSLPQKKWQRCCYMFIFNKIITFIDTCKFSRINNTTYIFGFHLVFFFFFFFPDLPYLSLILWHLIFKNLNKSIWLPNDVPKIFVAEWQIVQTLIRCHILWHLIWVYTVCWSLPVQILQVNLIL